MRNIFFAGLLPLVLASVAEAQVARDYYLNGVLELHKASNAFIENYGFGAALVYIPNVDGGPPLVVPVYPGESVSLPPLLGPSYPHEVPMITVSNTVRVTTLASSN